MSKPSVLGLACSIGTSDLIPFPSSSYQCVLCHTQGQQNSRTLKHQESAAVSLKEAYLDLLCCPQTWLMLVQRWSSRYIWKIKRLHPSRKSLSTLYNMLRSEATQVTAGLASSLLWLRWMSTAHKVRCSQDLPRAWSAKCPCPSTFPLPPLADTSRLSIQ